MIAILRHELLDYFHSFTTYIYCGFILLFVGVGALIYNIQSAISNFEYVLSFVSIGLVVIVPILTMRCIAEEKKQKTDQLLYSLPVSTTDIILGKFFAIALIALIPTIIISIYPLIFSAFGDVYLPTSYGSLFAFYLMTLSLISVGMFASSLTENQGLAAVIGIGLMLFNYFSVSLSEYATTTAAGSLIGFTAMVLVLAYIMEHLTKNTLISYGIALVLEAVLCITFVINKDLFEGLLPKLMTNLSLFERFNAFVNGVFDISGIIYFISVIVFFLFCCISSMEKRRYN